MLCCAFEYCYLSVRRIAIRLTRIIRHNKPNYCGWLHNYTTDQIQLFVLIRMENPRKFKP